MQNRRAISLVETLIVVAAVLAISVVVGFLVRTRATSHAAASGTSVEVGLSDASHARISSTLISAFPMTHCIGNLQTTTGPNSKYHIDFDYKVDLWAKSVKAKFLIQLNGTALSPIETTLPITSTQVNVPITPTLTAHAVLKPHPP